MDIKSRKILSKAMAALVFSAAVSGSTIGNLSASAYDGGTDDKMTDENDLGTSNRGILGVADEFSVFLRGDYTQSIDGSGSSVDIGDGHGTIAVGGNFDIGYWGDTVCDRAEVAGTITGHITNAIVNSGANCTIDFDSAFSQLRSASERLAGLKGITYDKDDPLAENEDGSYIQNQWGSIVFKGVNPDINVFNITVDQLNALKTGNYAGDMSSEQHSLFFDVPYGSAVIVNITGSGMVDLAFSWGVSYSTTGQLTSGNK